jgi:hypothetical protein
MPDIIVFDSCETIKNAFIGLIMILLCNKIKHIGYDIYDLVKYKIVPKTKKRN